MFEKGSRLWFRCGELVFSGFIGKNGLIKGFFVDILGVLMEKGKYFWDFITIGGFIYFNS